MTPRLKVMVKPEMTNAMASFSQWVGDVSAVVGPDADDVLEQQAPIGYSFPDPPHIWSFSKGSSKEFQS